MSGSMEQKSTGAPMRIYGNQAVCGHLRGLTPRFTEAFYMPKYRCQNAIDPLLPFVIRPATVKPIGLGQQHDHKLSMIPA